jgi:hypothetical protein
LRQLLHQSRLFLLVSCLLCGLLLLTLPVSYAVWREVLGVAVEVDSVSEPTATIFASSIPSVTTATPTLTPSAISTGVPTSNIHYEATPTDLAPTVPLVTEEPETEIPSIEEFPVTETPQTELQTEPPAETQPPSG